jgi:hypothetical protein
MPGYTMLPKSCVRFLWLLHRWNPFWVKWKSKIFLHTKLSSSTMNVYFHILHTLDAPWRPGSHRLEPITTHTALQHQSPVSSNTQPLIMHYAVTISRGYDLLSFKSHFTPELSPSPLYCHINNFTCSSKQTAERIPTVYVHSGMRRLVPDNNCHLL